MPKNRGKFKKSPRITVTTEVLDQGKRKERTSPGPAAYDQSRWRSLHGKKKPLGAAQQTDSRVNFTEDYVAPLKANPSPDKYTKVALDSIRDRDRTCNISKAHFPRFDAKPQRPTPGPASYEKHTTIDKLKGPTKLGSFTKEARPDYFTKKAKRNFSPGPGAYKLVEAAKDAHVSTKLSTIASKRH